MKRILSIFLLLFLFLNLFACSKGDEYKTDVSTASVANAMVASLSAVQDYNEVQADYLSDFITVPEYVTSMHILISTEGNDLNELGVFFVDTEKGSVADAKALLEKYLTDSLEEYRSWYDSYIPEETPKLINAEIKVFGNYVIYAILSDADRASAFAAAEEVLTVK